MSFLAPPIECSLPFSLESFEAVNQRYFRWYRTKEDDNDEDGNDDKAKEEDGGENGKGLLYASTAPQVVLVHSNRMCVVALSDQHPVIKDEKRVKRVNFQVSKAERGTIEAKDETP
jgi:hypothetical protein